VTPQRLLYRWNAKRPPVLGGRFSLTTQIAGPMSVGPISAAHRQQFNCPLLLPLLFEQAFLARADEAIE
jgi:hypothetical protein